METTTSDDRTSVIDLSGIDLERRADVWTDMAPSIFPGLSIEEIDALPSIGTIHSIRMGAGSLCAIQSSSAEVRYAPLGEFGGAGLYFTIMLQIGGETSVRQRLRHCTLKLGDMCFIDECYPFWIEGKACSEILLLRMPRAMVLSRFAQVEHATATLLPGDDPGTRILANLLCDLRRIAPSLSVSQKLAAMSSVIHMVGAAALLSEEPGHWRAQKAQEFIELNLSVPGLSAEDVAQGQRISRRRLDQLMRDTIGLSITGYIWDRRLQQAALDLRDIRRTGSSIAQIAYASGFEDAAHFTRAFKRRFAMTPGQWRATTGLTEH